MNDTGAIAYFSDALTHTADLLSPPDQSEGYLSRGRAYSAKGDVDRALADYDEAIGLAAGR